MQVAPAATATAAAFEIDSRKKKAMSCAGRGTPLLRIFNTLSPEQELLVVSKEWQLCLHLPGAAPNFVPIHAKSM